MYVLTEGMHAYSCMLAMCVFVCVWGGGGQRVAVVKLRFRVLPGACCGHSIYLRRGLPVRIYS